VSTTTERPGASDSSSLPIWFRPEPGARRPRFSREQIAAAALEIADADGFDAVSMRRIATKLGAGTMSLYRYISAKSDLVALMDDALMGESLVPEGELPGDWREAVALIARQTRDALLRHPWAVQSLQGRGAGRQDGAFGPNGLKHFEQSLAAVAGAPLDTRAKLDLLANVDDFVFGHVLRAGEAQERAGQADSAYAETVVAFITEQLRSGQFPHIAALAQDPAAQSMLDTAALDERFERGLQALLDGAAPDPDRPDGPDALDGEGVRGGESG
jgi:AcrR family transcriptional regulator